MNRKAMILYSEEAMSVCDKITEAMHNLEDDSAVSDAFSAIASFYEFDPRAADVALKIASAILERDNVKLSVALAYASAKFYEWAMSVNWPWTYVMIHKGVAL